MLNFVLQKNFTQKNDPASGCESVIPLACIQAHIASTEQLPTAVSAAGSARTSASCSLASSRESSTSAPGPTPYKVLMLGGPAVGKSSLVLQFMTSEYLHAYDTSIDDESGEKSVSVLLAGEESELCFIDFATADLSVSVL
uniref:Uncharacterized protein LOC114338005 n=1 Tax=Diabrotica virgifera virgifera TaxID=50390 RepID=A0A6P7GKS1_DIAVI